jgi:hypothetical protein
VEYPSYEKVTVSLLSISRMGCPVMGYIRNCFKFKGMKIKKQPRFFNDFYQEDDL